VVWSTTSGSGPSPELLDPVVTRTIQLERATTPEAAPFPSGAATLNQNTNGYNFDFNQGLLLVPSFRLHAWPPVLNTKHYSCLSNTKGLQLPPRYP
jgi:hypothetical protein